MYVTSFSISGQDIFDTSEVVILVWITSPDWGHICVTLPIWGSGCIPVNSSHTILDFQMTSCGLYQGYLGEEMKLDFIKNL